MEINATMIKDLRERTGAGMSDCKKALTEVGGDMDKAVDYLRAKGLAKAAKSRRRSASHRAAKAPASRSFRAGAAICRRPKPPPPRTTKRARTSPFTSAHLRETSRGHDTLWLKSRHR